MNTVKKIVAVLLCGLISASMLVGCEPNQENSVNESEQLTGIGMEGVPNSAGSSAAESNGDSDNEGDFINGISYSLSSTGTEYEVTEYDGSVSDVVIVTEYKGLPVTKIGNDVFTNSPQLTGITIPSGITEISSYAFAGCANLATVEIAEGVTAINFGAFQNCTGLTRIVIPEGVTDIGDYAFQNCVSLSEITIPNSAKNIGARILEGCNSLETLTIPSVKSYLGYYFGADDNSGKWTHYNYPVPASLRTIILTNCTSVPAYAFNGCTNLTSVTLPDNLTGISEKAFYGCISLSHIVLPENLNNIGSDAFDSCNSLSSIVIPDSVNAIHGGAFGSCSSLSEVVIGNGVTYIGSTAFGRCTSLTSIQYNGTVAQGNTIFLTPNNWNIETPATEVVCSDGTVLLN